MNVSFRKMHGAGNDFVVLDERAGALPLSAPRIRALADRHAGIGCDQLIVLQPAADPAADLFMRIYNADGTEAGACGNATRCVVAMVGDAAAKPGDAAEAGNPGGTGVVVETVAGLLPGERLVAGQVRVDMGPPRFDWRQIPLAEPCDTLHLPLEGDAAACSMGNPHATVFVADLAAIDPAALGAALEHHRLFPERANIGFAQIVAPDRMALRVWERGAGLTRACGSGACAALVNAARRGLIGRAASVEMEGGTLHIAWRQSDDHVLMTGPVATAFEGHVDLATYPG